MEPLDPRRRASPGASAHRQEALGLALALLAVAWFVAAAWSVTPQLDDAYISYRYARNLLDGHGLVYNVGEYVEGYTNLLWTLLVAAGMALGYEAKVVGHALGVASGAAALLATYAYASTGLPRSRLFLAGAATCITASSASLLFWSTSGMETALLVASGMAALAAEARGRIGLATLAACVATLTRPDGGIVALVVLASHLLRERRRLPRVLLWPALYGALVLGLTAFRLAYYGSPLPNTFYAKVGGIPVLFGLTYLFGFLVSGAALLLVPVLLAGRPERRFWPGVAYVLTTVVYVVAIGGDVFAFTRFLLPVVPCLAALAVQGTLAAQRRSAYRGAVAGGFLLASFVWMPLGSWSVLLASAVLPGVWLVALRFGRRPALLAGASVAAALALLFASVSVPDALRSARVPRTVRETRQSHGYFERLAQRRTRVLADRGAAGELVAVASIGALGYFSRLRLLDLFGLTDPVIARHGTPADPNAVVYPGHHRTNAEYVFSRKPDYLIIARKGSERRQPPATLALWAHPELEAHYAWDPELEGYRRRPDPAPGGDGP